MWYKLNFNERLVELQKRRHKITLEGDGRSVGIRGLVAEYVRSELLKKKKEEDTKIEALVNDAHIHEKVLLRLAGAP